MDVNNPRSINTIKEEIADLDSLIKDTQLFIEEYPDDSALEFSLKDLQNQRNLLYQELENAHELINHLIFDVRLNSWDNNFSVDIPASFLGGFLTTYQNLVTSVVHSHNKDVKESGPIPLEVQSKAQLNVSATSTGSFRIIFSEDQKICKYLDVDSDITQSLGEINKIIGACDDFEKLKEIRKKYGARVISKYKDFIKILSKNNLDVTFYDSLGSKKYEPLNITHDEINRISNALDYVEKIPDEEISLYGRLVGKDHKIKSFHFEDDEGNDIKGKYSDELDDDLDNCSQKDRVKAYFYKKGEYIEAEEKEVEKFKLVKLEIIK